ncbi:hypothetical protein DH2020_049253 [Rehmannia glutinosa]|uniref:TFIIS N-terminal domain-containing protein n=1 Tax=Rehmannia glutinosa TaxID=99300 RepID=A0ABR0U3F2_REHGL
MRISNLNVVNLTNNSLMTKTTLFMIAKRDPLLQCITTQRGSQRLIKKSSGKYPRPVDFGLDDDVGDVGRDYAGDEFSDGGKRKTEKREKSRNVDKERKGEKGDIVRKSGGRMRDREADPEMKEMWDTIAGGNSEAAEGEEDDEIKELFKIVKKKKKNEKSAAEIGLLVENVMAELEVVVEDDAELNRQGKPAINKLKKLSYLTDVLSKKQLQQEFLDHGVLTLLKNWLDPLPDGSLPNINVRAAVLKILNDFPIDLEQYDRRQQLKKSGLGKVIMFFSKSDEETTANRKLAKELVDKWSRPVFNKSTRFEDMKNFEDERNFRRPSANKVMSKGAGEASRDDDLDLSELSLRQNSGQSSSRQHASRPEAKSMDFVVRPQSKVDPVEVRARAKQMAQNLRRMKMNKKLQQLKQPKRKQLQATKLSVKGRGMMKYL